MHSLSAIDLLNVWEKGLAQNPAQRALTLLAAACSDVSTEQLAKLPIGQRDVRLLQLRERIFGQELLSQATCQNCNEHLELSFKVSDILLTSEPETDEVLSAEVANYNVLFRVPNSFDLINISQEQDINKRRSVLFESCLVEANHNGKTKSASELPNKVVKTILKKIAQADPQANIEIRLKCAKCKHTWEMMFDILSFFWSEINAWAQHILYDVHVLASFYGWREFDILSMSAARRQIYLDIVRS